MPPVLARVAACGQQVSSVFQAYFQLTHLPAGRVAQVDALGVGELIQRRRPGFREDRRGRGPSPQPFGHRLVAVPALGDY
ncbi:hypothetical protein [Streptomyces sp. NPDC057748]